MEKNGKKSSTKNTKCINVYYYFRKVRVENGYVVIKNFPTKEMLGGDFTKPLQVAMFRKFRAESMNIPDDLEMVYGHGRNRLKKGDHV